MNTEQDGAPSYPNPEKANQTPKKDFVDAFGLTGVSKNILGRTIGTLVQLILLPIVGFILIMGIGFANPHNNAVTSILALLLSLVAVALAFMVAPAFDLTLLKGAKGERPGLKDVFKPALGYFWRYIALVIVVGLLTIIGLILLVIPGLFVMKWYLLAPYYLLDRNVGMIEAMKLSREASKTYSNQIWGVVGVQILINLLGAIPIVGWIGSIVWGVLYVGAPAARYVEVKAAEATKATSSGDISSVIA